MFVLIKEYELVLVLAKNEHVFHSSFSLHVDEMGAPFIPNIDLSIPGSLQGMCCHAVRGHQRHPTAKDPGLLAPPIKRQCNSSFLTAPMAWSWTISSKDVSQPPLYSTAEPRMFLASLYSLSYVFV